jgi:hypothetical protein
MMKSLYLLLSVDPGFRAERRLTVGVTLRGGQRYADDAAALGFWNQLLDRVRAPPSVETAAVGTVVPFAGDHSRGDITIEGMPFPTPSLSAETRAASAWRSARSMDMC